jgi:hypothetical protein
MYCDKMDKDVDGGDCMTDIECGRGIGTTPEQNTIVTAQGSCHKV